MLPTWSLTDVRPVDPALLHEHALQAELRGHRRDLAGVVGLHAADRDERVAPCASASATRYSSLRVLLPPNARPELQSSRLAQIRGAAEVRRSAARAVHRATGRTAAALAGNLWRVMEVLGRRRIATEARFRGGLRPSSTPAAAGSPPHRRRAPEPRRASRARRPRPRGPPARVTTSRRNGSPVPVGSANAVSPSKTCGPGGSCARGRRGRSTRDGWPARRCDGASVATTASVVCAPGGGGGAPAVMSRPADKGVDFRVPRAGHDLAHRRIDHVARRALTARRLRADRHRRRRGCSPDPMPPSSRSAGRASCPRSRRSRREPSLLGRRRSPRQRRDDPPRGSGHATAPSPRSKIAAAGTGSARGRRRHRRPSPRRPGGGDAEAAPPTRTRCHRTAPTAWACVTSVRGTQVRLARARRGTTDVSADGAPPRHSTASAAPGQRVHVGEWPTSMPERSVIASRA